MPTPTRIKTKKKKKSRMSLAKLVHNRYSCRKYSSKEVSNEVINEMFELCRYAPSAVNLQPWEFIVVNKPELLEKLFTSYKRDWIRSASTIIICLGNREKAWVRSDGKNHTDIDVSIIIDHLTLAATEKGLATCWVCNFNVSKVANDFNIPQHLEPVALLPLGYPETNEVPVKKRKDLSEILHFNSL